MNYKFVSMNEDYANEIAYKWKYDGIYSFYDMTADKDDLEEFLNEENWKEQYFAVLDEKDSLVGFYSFSFEDEIMWIGFGLKPNLVGIRKGFEFVSEGIKFGLRKFNYQKPFVLLAVASFNERAIKLYNKIGFKFQEKYIEKTNGGEFEFIRMKKEI